MKTDSAAELARLGTLIDAIYACATEPARWEPVLSSIVEWIGAPRGILFTPLNTPDTGGFYFNHAIPPFFMELLQTRYQEQDPWVEASLRLDLIKEGNIVNGDYYVPYEELIKTDFYKEFLALHDTVHILSGIVYGMDSPGGLPVAICTAHRGEKEGRFSRHEEARMRILMPHLSRALGVMYRLRDAELKVASSLAALDRLSVGVLLIGERHAVVYANPAAKRLLEEDDGIRLQPAFGSYSEDRLVLDDPRTADEVRAALHEAVSPDILTTAHFSRSIAVRRPSGRTPYVLNFSSLPQQNEFGQGAATPRAIVFLSGGDKPVHVDAALLAKTYGLTSAEIKAVRLTAEGLTLEETAKQLGISPNTLKSQLKQIYAKTHVSSRIQLVKLIHSLANPFA